jgi:DNA polymerase family A
MEQLINSTYEHKLASCYHRIDKRGLCIDLDALGIVRDKVQAELDSECDWFTQQFGFPVHIGKIKGLAKGQRSLNLNSPDKVLNTFKDLGYKIPKIRIKSEETDEYEFKESVKELAMRRLMADPTLWPHPQGGDAIKRYLNVKELVTFRNRTINARLRILPYGGIYYSSYNVAATVTGRRGSKKSVFGFGNNAQNIPARTSTSSDYRNCIIARPGRVFFFVDQKQAEDWPVQALSQNYTALEEMRKGVNRHYKFASIIFNRSIDSLKAGRKNHEFEAELQYNLGKRGRHANNYGMRPQRLSETLTTEGYSVPVSTCEAILDKINKADPNVSGIFHPYIQKCIYDTRILRTPLGRECQFFGVRQNDKNYAILNEAYAWIPQSTIGDNTGLAVLYLDACNNYVIQEGHDSIVQECPDSLQELHKVYEDTEKAFKRTIRFHNGIEVEIPLEGKLGYDWLHTVEIKDWSKDGVAEAYDELKQSFKNRYDVKREIANNGTTSQEAVAGSIS